MQNVALIAAGSGLTFSEIELAQSCDVVIAVDGGFKVAIAAGCIVDRVVGDLDSLTPQGVARATELGVEIVRFDPDKDQSDLELALAAAVQVHEVGTVHVFGARGGRPDHAAVGAAVLAAPTLGHATIVAHLGDTRLHVVHTEVEIREPTGTVVSLLAHGGVAEGVTTTGLRWALDNATLRPDHALGLSNEVIADPAGVRLTGGTLFVYVTSTNAR